LKRPTGWILLGIAAAMIAHGCSALRAAERSAAHGGGLLGGYGYLPIALGILLACIAIVGMVLGKKKS